MNTERFDVLIVGAGISGIGAAHHLQEECPSKSYAILEGREAIGGTWDLFRYPGIRSDSDMYTLGYKFKPWLKGKVLAEGSLIREYVQEAAAENDIKRHIRFGHRVVNADTRAAVELVLSRRHHALACVKAREDGNLPGSCRAGFHHPGFYEQAILVLVDDKHGIALQ